MKGNEALFTIIEIRPGTYDSTKDSIVDADVQLQSEDMVEVWAFAMNWSMYFPYHEPHHPYGTGQTLVRNLLGKKIKAILAFLDFGYQTPKDKVKSIVQKEGGRSIDYVITGIVTGNEPVDPTRFDPDEFEWVYLDCGITITTRVKKNQYSIGDWLTAKGRMDVHLIEC